mmetsp:Transcript_28008/g.96831  ORF Transcript_28008/g.96831 Transcript_28008/m.96831 type:complete len:359 (-) Transcript_28008:161-1237(-)
MDGAEVERVPQVRTAVSLRRRRRHREAPEVRHATLAAAVGAKVAPRRLERLGGPVELVIADPDMPRHLARHRLHLVEEPVPYEAPAARVAHVAGEHHHLLRVGAELLGEPVDSLPRRRLLLDGRREGQVHAEVTEDEHAGGHVGAHVRRRHERDGRRPARRGAADAVRVLAASLEARHRRRVQRARVEPRVARVRRRPAHVRHRVALHRRRRHRRALGPVRRRRESHRLHSGRIRDPRHRHLACRRAESQMQAGGLAHVLELDGGAARQRRRRCRRLHVRERVGRAAHVDKRQRQAASPALPPIRPAHVEPPDHRLHRLRARGGHGAHGDDVVPERLRHTGPRQRHSVTRGSEHGRRS